MSIWSCFLPLFLGLAWLFYLSKESGRILLIVFLACIAQLIHALKLKNQTFESLAYNIYTPFEFYLLFTIFYSHVENKKNKLLLKITAAVYSIASLFFLSYFDIAKGFIPEWAIFNNVFYTAWILIIFFEQYGYNNTRSLDFRDCFFWYVLGLLLYAPCTGMIFSMWKYLHQDNNSILRMVHEVFNINMYILFTIGFYKEYSLKKSVSV